MPLHTGPVRARFLTSCCARPPATRRYKHVMRYCPSGLSPWRRKSSKPTDSNNLKCCMAPGPSLAHGETNPDPSIVMHFSLPLPIAALILATATAPRLEAQRAVAQLAIGGGSGTDARGISSSAWTVAPSLALASRSTVLRLG